MTNDPNRRTNHTMETHMSVILPNIRKIFIPDPGMLIADADLSGADAQVVAWESEDEDLKAAFRSGVKIHEKNAEDLLGIEYTSAVPHVKRQLYADLKRLVHGTNYVGSARTIAMILGWPIARATAFQRRWFTLHPSILLWHQRLSASLAKTRSVSNKFGYRRVYFDRIESVLPEACAWIPQSTIATTCFKGAVRLHREIPWCQILLQNHDSLVFQFPTHRIDSLWRVQKCLENTIPYDDPLTIQWSLAVSDKSWGDVEKRKWPFQPEDACPNTTISSPLTPTLTEIPAPHEAIGATALKSG